MPFPLLLTFLPVPCLFQSTIQPSMTRNIPFSWAETHPLRLLSLHINLLELLPDCTTIYLLTYLSQAPPAKMIAKDIKFVKRLLLPEF